jgi:hypothetical protein
MTADLTASEYAYLIILRAENREINNKEMGDRYDVRLIGLEYTKLNAEGLIVSVTKPRPYRHAITDKGRKLLAEPLAIGDTWVDEGKKRSPAEKVLWAALVAQQNGKPAKPAPVSTPAVEPAIDLDGQIRAAYTKLAAGPGEWVGLTELRPLFGDVSKAELDKALIQMLEAHDVRLEPDPLEHRVGAEARNAAVHVGGEDRHKLAIGRR